MVILNVLCVCVSVSLCVRINNLLYHHRDNVEWDCEQESAAEQKVKENSTIQLSEEDTGMKFETHISCQ